MTLDVTQVSHDIVVMIDNLKFTNTDLSDCEVNPNQFHWWSVVNKWLQTYLSHEF